MERMYLCIDLKTFYASVECVERGLDPFKTNLVVADPTRGPGAICLAITPAMKAHGIHNRCRLFDIPKNIKYIAALPRMKLYIKYSADVYSVYLKYLSPEDIYAYSIDECFLDITSYLKLYGKTPIELAKMIREDVFQTTKICATAGIGTNLFLTKVALDVTAKHSPDFIGYLDNKAFKEQIWHHKPITDIWNIGRGIAKRLEKYKAFDLYDVTQIDPKILYKEFGVNAEFLIDHAHGEESCTLKEIRDYKSQGHSISNSQILFEDYNYKDALMVLHEMVDVNCLTLIENHLVTNGIFLFVRYSKDVRKPSNGSMSIDVYTDSCRILTENFVALFKRIVDDNYPIRGISIGFANVIDEAFMTYDLFTDEEELKKEKRVQEAILGIKHKYGKNSIIKGVDLKEKATTIKRNKLLGGHNSE